MIALDSNVIIYLLDAHVEFGETSRKLLKKLEQTTIRVIASELLIFEVLSRGGGTDREANALLERLEMLNIDYGRCSMTILLQAARLRREANLGALDSIHVANAIEKNATHFITNDKQLLKKEVNDIKIVSLMQWDDAI